MKKIFIITTLTAVFYACGGSGTENPGTNKGQSKSSNPDYEKGLALVAKQENLCLTCHKIEEKFTGPAYRDVANKYENTEANIKMLAKKVKEGGAGVWGDVPMPKNPVITLEEAEQMVKYILLLKN